MIFDWGDALLHTRGRLLFSKPLAVFSGLPSGKLYLPLNDPIIFPEKNPRDTKNEDLAAQYSLAYVWLLRKSKSKGFVLSLSGGADSST